MNKNGKRKGKMKMWIVILVIVVIVVGGAAGGILIDSPGRREIGELTLSNLDFKNLRNGNYIGEYKGTKSHSRDVKVEVVISGGEISDVKIQKGAVDKEGKPVELGSVK